MMECWAATSSGGTAPTRGRSVCTSSCRASRCGLKRAGCGCRSRRRVAVRRRPGACRAPEAPSAEPAMHHGRETFLVLVRSDDDAMAPRFAAGDGCGSIATSRRWTGASWRRTTGSVNGPSCGRWLRRTGGWVLRALDPNWPDRVLDGDAVMAVRGVAVFQGGTV